ncbi:hypothetical protein BXQ27_21910, partial [Klebsiella aerogenes]
MSLLLNARVIKVKLPGMTNDK